MARDFELIDVSHSIEDGMITYKGLPAPVITDSFRARPRVNNWMSSISFT